MWNLDSKVIQLLKGMSRKEINEFGRLLGSPCFRADKYIKSLFACLKRHHPLFNSKVLSPAYLLEETYKGEERRPGNTFNRTVATLVKLLENYLILIELDRPSPQRTSLMINIYNQRSNYKLMSSKLRTFYNQIEKKENIGSYELGMVNNANFDQYFHPSYLPSVSLDVSKAFLQKSARDSMTLFALTSLRLIAEANFKRIQFGQEIEIEFREDMLRMARHCQSENPLIGIYLSIIEYSEQLEPELFDSMFELMQSNIKAIPEIDQGIIANSLINYALVRILKGDKAFVKTALNVYRFSIVNHCLEREGFLPDMYLSGAIALACDNGYIEDAEFILSNSTERLDLSIRDSVVRFNQAYLSFAQADFEGVLKAIHETEFHSFFYKINSRNLILKAYFELNQRGGEYPILSFCHSFQTFISRQKNYDLSRNANLVKVVRQLASMTPGKEQGIRAALKAEISTMNIASRDWVVSKLG